MSQDNTSPEFAAFTRLVDHVLAVPHSEIVLREAEYQRQAKANPRRRGPKPKIKPSISDPAPKS